MPRSKAPSRTLSADEKARLERRIEGLLAECIEKHQHLWPGDADYAEAHGIYHTVRTLGFSEADEMWDRLREIADAPRLEQLRRQMELPISCDANTDNETNVSSDTSDEKETLTES